MQKVVMLSGYMQLCGALTRLPLEAECWGAHGCFLTEKKLVSVNWFYLRVYRESWSWKGAKSFYWLLIIQSQMAITSHVGQCNHHSNFKMFDGRFSGYMLFFSFSWSLFDTLWSYSHPGFINKHWNVCMHVCACAHKCQWKIANIGKILIGKVYCGSKEFFLSCYCNISNCNVRKPEAEALLVFLKYKMSRKCSNSESWLSVVRATHWAKTSLTHNVNMIWVSYYHLNI